jgi:predicted dithiol-disulfide oxidoreductase (DUF899 family)
MVKVEKNYVFDSPNGKTTLADLFGGKSQLIVYHFMFGPEWNEGCPSCSCNMDHTDGSLVHLAQQDVSFAAISRAPSSKIESFKNRMGWKFNWVSSYANDFNRDYGVFFTKEELASENCYNFGTSGFPSEEAPGISVFHKKGKDIFHTYSIYARGAESVLNTYNYPNISELLGGMSTKVNAMPIVKLETPRFEDHGPLLIAGLAGRYTASTLDDLPALWDRFSAHIGKIPGQVGRVAYGVCSDMSNGTGSFPYLSGVQVSESSELLEQISFVQIPAQRSPTPASRKQRRCKLQGEINE